MQGRGQLSGTTRYPPPGWRHRRTRGCTGFGSSTGYFLCLDESVTVRDRAAVVSSRQALMPTYLQWPRLSTAWKLADGHRIHPEEKNCPVSPELAKIGKSLGTPKISLQGGGKHHPVPGSPGDTGPCWWGLVVAAQLSSTEHPGLFQPSLYPLKVGNCFLLWYPQVVWAEYFIAAA